MIARLSGKLISKQPNAIIIDVSGVGYEVTIPLSTFYVLSDVSTDVTLRIHTHVRDDALQLFGFQTSREKELFLKLTSVSGVGPKLAIAMLSMPVSELVPAICSNDLARLTTIPGVGRKTAERVVVELRDKVAGIAAEAAQPATVAKADQVSMDVRDDTIAALVQLGYPKPAAERTVLSVLREDGEHSIESVLKRSLKHLSR